MKILLPPIKPYTTQHVAVDDMHQLYVEESGSPTGVPILFIHGGPGAGCSPDDRRYFDPEYYRIILFDQRGCGHSTPYGSLEKNTTQDLIQDIEKIRHHLGIDRWIVFGGSWGSTLGLLYAQANPTHVMGLILRGIFLGREMDYRWLYTSGASHIFPDYWQEFILPIPEEERHNLLAAYHKRLGGEDEIARMNAAKHWAQWEAQCATLHPCKTVVERLTNAHTAMSLSLIETHFFVNHCFMKPNQILHDAYKLEGIPGIIVHGRYDMLCTLDNAYVLHHAWSGSELHVIRDAGHAASEPGTTDALMNAVELMQRYTGEK